MKNVSFAVRYFFLTLPNLNKDSYSFDANDAKNEPQKNELLESIIRLIKANSAITRKEISIKLGKSVGTIFKV